MQYNISLLKQSNYQYLLDIKNAALKDSTPILPRQQLSLALGVLLIAFCASGFAQSEAAAPSAAKTTAASPADRVSEIEAARIELEAMSESDQKHRAQLGKATTEDETKALWKAQGEIDKKNQTRLDQIVTIHGWIKRSVFGDKAAMAAFLIVQHADLPKMKRYAPMIEAALLANELRKDYYALFFDRVRMYEDKPQRYGTQIRSETATGAQTFWKIEDVKNVDARRKEMGMPPLSEYAKFFRVPLPKELTDVAQPASQSEKPKPTE